MLSSLHYYSLIPNLPPHRRIHCGMQTTDSFNEPLTYDTITLIVPYSADADAVLKLRTNRRVLNNTDAFDLPGNPPSFGKARRVVGRIDFAFFLGRRYISVGSSRLNNIKLPPTSDISDHHFLIYFDIQTATLMLRDISSSGITVRSGL